MASPPPTRCATPPHHPRASSSSSSTGSLSDASTATDLSSSLDDSGSDSDFNPSRVNFGPQKTPERRFLRKVRRKDSREFYRRQTINWGLDGEGRDTIERREGDDEVEQQPVAGDDVRIEDPQAEEEEDPSTHPELSSAATPSKSPASTTTTQLTPGPTVSSLVPRSSPPAYDGDAESEGDQDGSDDEACMIDVLEMGGMGAAGVDDSFDEVPEADGEDQAGARDVTPQVEEQDAFSESEDSSEQPPSPRLASPSRQSPTDATLHAPHSPLPSDFVDSETEDDMEATFVDDQDSEWEDEHPSREEPDDHTDAFANEQTFVAEPDFDLEAELELQRVEDVVEPAGAVEEDSLVELELTEPTSQVDEHAEPAVADAAVIEALETLVLDDRAEEQTEKSVGELVAQPTSALEQEGAVTEPLSLDQLIEVDGLVEEVTPVEELQVIIESASSPEVSISTPSKSMASFLDSSPTPYHSLPVLLPTPTQAASSSRSESQAEESFVSQSPELALSLQDQSVISAADSEMDVEGNSDAVAGSFMEPEMSASPSKPDFVDEEVEYGRNGPVPLVVQILSSPSDLSPLPSSDSDSSASLVRLGTPTPPSSSTPRARHGQGATASVPTPLRQNESLSSSSSTSATPPSHARKQAPIGLAEKRPTSKVLKRASPQKSAAAKEQKADRLAQRTVRAQLDAAMARSGPSPMKSASKPRPLDTSVSRSFGPSPRVGFVRTLARVTPSPTASTSTSRLPPRTLAQSQASASASASTSKALTPPPLQRSTAIPPPASVPRSILKKTTQPPSAPAPSAASTRPIFASRAAPPQPASALKASRTTSINAVAGPSTVKPAASHLPKPSAGSGIPKPASYLQKGPSARVPPPLAASSSRAPLGGNPRPGQKQPLKTFGSWSSAGAPSSNIRRAGGDTSMSMPVSSTASFSRSAGAVADSESSFRMDSSFRMESPRVARPTLGEPVRVASPMKTSVRHGSSMLSSGPVRMPSPVKTASFGSSFGASSHHNRGRDGPFAASVNASIFAQSVSSHVPGTFSEHKPPPSPPRKAANTGGAFLASIAAKAPTSLRDGKSLALPLDSSASSSKEPSLVNDSHPTPTSSSPPAAPAPSSPSKSKSDATSAAPPSDPSSAAPARSLRTRAPPPAPAEPARPPPASASTSRPTPKPTASDSMSVAQLKSFTLVNTKKNQVYFSALEKVVVRRDGENRPVSPGEKVKKAGKEWEATAGKKRKPLFDEPESDDESDEELEAEERKTHVRGPGEDEDFFSPVKSASKGGRGKRSRGGAGEEMGATGVQKKGVKWDKGLVWIRSRKHESLELEGEGDGGVGMTRGRKAKKGCIRAAKVPLDAMGNLPLTLPPLTEFIKRDKVVYTQIVYDDDPAASAPAPAAKGKAKK